MFFARKKYYAKTQASELNTSIKKIKRLNTTYTESMKSQVTYHSNTKSGNKQEIQQRSKIINHLQNLSMLQTSPRHKLQKQHKVNLEHLKKKESKNFFASPRVDIQSKMSTQSQKNILAYGVSTFKGENNINNSHHLGIHLGIIKNFMMTEAFEGSFAAKFIKDHYPLQMIDITARKSDNPQVSIKSNMEQSFKNVQQKLVKSQIDHKNNSGAFLVSVIVTDQQVIVGNCGLSLVLCENRSGGVKELSKIHNTNNRQELQRLKKNNAWIYQETISMPYQNIDSFSTPLKIGNTGLSCSRILGRAYDYRRQKYESCGLTSSPEIITTKAKDILWIGIFSETIQSACDSRFISQIIKQEIKKKSMGYNEHHIAMQCSRKIVYHYAIKTGSQSASAIIIFLSQVPEYQNKKTKVLFLRSNDPKLRIKKSEQRPKSLRYVGNRKSFIKEHSVSHHNRSCNYSKSVALKDDKVSIVF